MDSHASPDLTHVSPPSEGQLSYLVLTVGLSRIVTCSGGWPGSSSRYSSQAHTSAFSGWPRKISCHLSLREPESLTASAGDPLHVDLRVPWTARSSQQLVLKEISLEYSLEGLMLRLKLQYFGHLLRRAHSLEKTLMLGKIEGKRRKGQQRMRWLDSITDSTDMNQGKLWETVEHRRTWHTAVYGVAESQTWVSRLNSNNKKKRKNCS